MRTELEQEGTEARRRKGCWASAAVLMLVSCMLAAQSPRERTRPAATQGTAVTDTQAIDLTLTLSQAAMRPVQTWVRTAGSIDKNA